MKIYNKFKILVLTAGVLLFTGCTLEGGESLNGASTSSISVDISRGELQQAAAGVLSDMRVSLALQTDVQSMFGREYYFLTGSDPRFEGDVVTGNLDNNTFYTTGPWGARYATIKDINLILSGIEGTTADFSAAEIAGAKGALNTFKALELLMISNNQYTNGLRIDVADPDNLGPFVDYPAALTAIADMLSAAGSNLSTGGNDIPFELTSGYDNISMLQFNKALAARVEAYRGNYTAVLSLLNESFMDLDGDLKNGAYHTFSLAGADVSNGLFNALNQTAIVRVSHSSFINDALTNDNRVAKVVLRDSPTSASGLIGTHDVWIYQTNVDPVPIIRNAELILLYAEANMASNPNEALKAINKIRNAAGLGNYLGSTSPFSLENEILFQKRYELFGEGHRWIDLRRFDRLAELPNDRATDKVPTAVPIPANENQ